MKILAINFILCLVLSINLYGQTIPESPEVLDTTVLLTAPQAPQPSSSTPPQAPVAPVPPDGVKVEDASEEGSEDEDGFEINININNRDTSNRSILRVGMLDLGISTYVDGSTGKIDLPNELEFMDQRLSRSINVGIHLINIKSGFRKKEYPQNFGFSTGIKWNIVHYSFEKDFSASRNQDRFEDGLDFNVPALRHNRLKANYVQVPFLLEYNSKPHSPSKSINIAVGFSFQLLLNSNYKYKVDDTGDKTKVKGDFNLSKFQTPLEVRFGYGPLNFYVQYAARLFQELDGPYLKPLNIGVNIIPR